MEQQNFIRRAITFFCGRSSEFKTKKKSNELQLFNKVFDGTCVNRSNAVHGQMKRSSSLPCLTKMRNEERIEYDRDHKEEQFIRNHVNRCNRSSISNHKSRFETRHGIGKLFLCCFGRSYLNDEIEETGNNSLYYSPEESQLKDVKGTIDNSTNCAESRVETLTNTSTQKLKMDQSNFPTNELVYPSITSSRNSQINLIHSSTKTKHKDVQLEKESQMNKNNRSKSESDAGSFPNYNHLESTMNKTSGSLNVNERKERSSFELMCADGALRHYSRSTLTLLDRPGIFDDKRISEYLALTPSDTDEEEKISTPSESFNSETEDVFYPNVVTSNLNISTQNVYQASEFIVHDKEIDAQESENESILIIAPPPSPVQRISEMNAVKNDVTGTLANSPVFVHRQKSQGDGYFREIPIGQSSSRAHDFLIDSEDGFKQVLLTVNTSDSPLKNLPITQEVLPDNQFSFCMSKKTESCSSYDKITSISDESDDEMLLVPNPRSLRVASGCSYTELETGKASKVNHHLHCTFKNSHITNDIYPQTTFKGRYEAMASEKLKFQKNFIKSPAQCEYNTECIPEQIYSGSNSLTDLDARQFNSLPGRVRDQIVYPKTYYANLNSKAVCYNQQTVITNQFNKLLQPFVSYPHTNYTPDSNKSTIPSHFPYVGKNRILPRQQSVQRSCQWPIPKGSSEDIVFTYYPFIDGPLASNFEPTYSVIDRKEPIGAEKSGLQI